MPGGRLIHELGYNSLEGVRRMPDDKWHDIASVHDFAQVPRVLSLSRFK
jgi:hypothetical protein